MNMISMKKLANTVHTARKERGLTQQEVQELTGINRQLIGRIEKGEFLPSLPQLNELAEKLQFSITQLLEDDSEQNVFYAMRGEAKSDEEREGIEQLFSMMGFLKSQMLLRSRIGKKYEL